MDDSPRPETRQASGSCFFGDFDAGRPRVLFVGNSITLHGIKEDIGWTRVCGMAASAPEKDYVHLLMRRVCETYPSASYAIAQAADWERTYREPERALRAIEGARAWDADVVVLRLGENMPGDGMTEVGAAEAFVRLKDWLDPRGRARFVVTDTFYASPILCAALYRAALQTNARFVSIADLGRRDDPKALGLFAHEGVANHPGDAGMASIAERLYCVVRDAISEVKP